MSKRIEKTGVLATLELRDAVVIRGRSSAPGVADDESGREKEQVLDAAAESISAPARVLPRPDGKSMPYKFTAARAKAVADAIGEGAHVLIACRLAGITTPTYYAWQKMGREDGEGPLWDFREAVITAMAKAELARIKQVTGAGESDWRAAAWMLESRYPERWSSKSRVEMTGKNGGAIAIEHGLAKLSDAELEAKIAAAVLSSPGLRAAVLGELQGSASEQPVIDAESVSETRDDAGPGVSAGDD